MKKLDRRIVRSRKALADAIASLTMEQGYDNLTVTAVTQYAGVGSSTFYRHFRDKDDLLWYVVRGMMQGLKDVVAEARSPREEAVLKFRYARQTPKGFLLYGCLPHDNQARQMARCELEGMVRERFEPRDSSHVDPDLAVDYILSACHGLTIWYLNNMERYSPDEIAEIYVDLVVRATAEVAFVPREDWLQRFN